MKKSLIAALTTPILIVLQTIACAVDVPQKSLPLPGEVFLLQGRTAFVILPDAKPANGLIPWVWYAPTLPSLPEDSEKWMFQRFLQAGIAIVGIDVGESYGSPDGRALYTAFYRELTLKRGFAHKAIMLGRSRGGLMTLCWAAENADKVAGFAGIYPVCNIASYPGLDQACGAYKMTTEGLKLHLKEHNPIDRLAALAKAGVPMFAIHGDVDTLVPLEANSGEMEKRYEALGGKMQLIVPPGQGHNMWEGFFQCSELVDFVKAQALCLDDTTVKGTRNLALGKQCKVFSSLEREGWSAKNITDGLIGSSGWRSKAFADFPDHSLYPEFVEVDLGSPAVILRVVLHPAKDGGFPKDFEIAVSNEGEPWRVVLKKNDYPQPKGTDPQTFIFKQVPARFIKITATRLNEAEESKYRFALSEMEVIGAPTKIAPLKTAKWKLPETKTRVAHLRCEDMENPLGIDESRPRFSWWMESSERGKKQTSCRILIARSKDALAKCRGDVWDSGRVDSDTNWLDFAGKPGLTSQTPYWWTVMSWDEHGKPLAWADPGYFVTGIVSGDSWRGKWIAAETKDNPSRAAAVYMRKEVDIKKPVLRATACISGLGWSELYINGNRVGNDFFTPGFTNYSSTVGYMTYDVTPYFRSPGIHAFGAILGNGWYDLSRATWGYFSALTSMPNNDVKKLILDVRVTYKDGTVETFNSDKSWKWNYGEIVSNWLCTEDIELQTSLGDWSQPGYDDKAWSAVLLANSPTGKLSRQVEQPCRVLGQFKPQRLDFNKDTGVWTYDFGREFTGNVRFRASGPKGTRISIRLMPTRNLIVHHGDNHGYTSYFTLSGSGVEEYSPRFCFTDVGVVEVSGVAQAPKLEDMTGVNIATDMGEAGLFSCSDDTLNWLHDCVERTQRNYVTYVPNDATRERVGWMQDAENMFLSSSYMFDSKGVYSRWLRDLMQLQSADGNLPNVAPGPGTTAALDGNSPWWGGMGVWLPWHIYQIYGDDRLIRQHYDGMKRYVDFLTARAKNYEQHGWGLTDWVSIDGTDGVMVNTAPYYFYACIMSKSAAMLGKNQDAAKYDELAQAIKSHFNETFLDSATGKYRVKGVSSDKHYMDIINDATVCPPTTTAGSQTAQALPLQLGLAPDDMRPAIEKALLEDIKIHNNHIGTGFVGTTYLLQNLMDLAPEAGHAMTMQRDSPSWHAMTVGTDHDQLQEFWNGRVVCMPSEGGPLGHWFYQGLAGIRPDPDGPGFRKIIIKPNCVGDLHWVKGSCDSPTGRIECNWYRRGNQLILHITVPANTTATLYIPAKDADVVTDGGKPAAKANGLKFLRMESGAAIFVAESGSYQFESQLK